MSTRRRAACDRTGVSGGGGGWRGSGGCLALVTGLALVCGCAAGGPDRFERVNRAIFGFNQGVDLYLLEPAAKGWDFVVPELVQTGIGNFFANLRMPVVMVNDLLQGKPDPAVYDYCRLFVNTTAGVGGLVDVASMLGIPSNEEDFGLTLGHWGVPAGPYIVLPLLGPSTPRDAVGMAADSAGNLYYSYFLPWYANAGLRATYLLNLRAKLLEEVEESRRSSLDFYVFVRDAYLQSRRHKLEGRREGLEREPSAAEEDLYYPEEDLGEGDEDLDLE